MSIKKAFFLKFWNKPVFYTKFCSGVLTVESITKPLPIFISDVGDLSMWDCPLVA